MAISYSETVKYAARVKVEAQENSIIATVANMEYQVESAGAKTVKIIGVSTPTIAPYTPGGTLTYEDLTDNETDLNLDQMNEFSFRVNEVEKMQSAPDYVPPAIVKSGRALGRTADAYFLGSDVYGNADIPAENKIGSIGSSEEILEVNVLRYTSTAARKLREQHVQRDQAWMVVPPWYMQKIAEAAGQRLQDNMQVFEFGTVFKYAGLNIVESTEVVAAGTGDDEYQILAFSQRAIPFAATVQKVESLMNPTDFGELVRGLYVFGATVLYPDEVVVMSAEEGVET